MGHAFQSRIFKCGPSAFCSVVSIALWWACLCIAPAIAQGNVCHLPQLGALLGDGVFESSRPWPLVLLRFGVCADAYQRKIAQKVQFFVCDISTGLLLVRVLWIEMLDRGAKLKFEVLFRCLVQQQIVQVGENNPGNAKALWMRIGLLVGRLLGVKKADFTLARA